MGILPACMSVHVHAVYREASDGVGFFGNGITDVFKPPCGCWELNQGHLLLSVEPSLQNAKLNC